MMPLENSRYIRSREEEASLVESKKKNNKLEDCPVLLGQDGLRTEKRLHLHFTSCDLALTSFTSHTKARIHGLNKNKERLSNICTPRISASV